MFPSNLFKGHYIKASLAQPNQKTVQQSIKNILKRLETPYEALNPQLEARQHVKSKYSRICSQSSNMATICSKCDHRLIHPPSLFSLHRHYPSLMVNATLDRSQLRCQHCDEMLANNLAIEAELPPPSYSSPVVKLEKTIQTLKRLVEEEIEEEDEQRILKSVIHSMQIRWANVVKERDADIRSAWKPYWGIWGVLEGQQAFSRF